MSGQGKGRVALVTGAGQGIGRAVALGLLRNGYRVALCGRRQETLDETLTLAAGAEGLAVATDVSKPDQVAALFQAIGTNSAASTWSSTMPASTSPAPPSRTSPSRNGRRWWRSTSPAASSSPRPPSA